MDGAKEFAKSYSLNFKKSINLSEIALVIAF